MRLSILYAHFMLDITSYEKTVDVYTSKSHSGHVEKEQRTTKAKMAAKVIPAFVGAGACSRSWYFIPHYKCRSTVMRELLDVITK